MQNTTAQRREEAANALSHGVGLLASLVALPFLVAIALRRSDGLAALGVAIFGVSLLSLYVTSTVYHSLPVGPAKDMWRRLDHAAIYVLIAGTYTPFSLGALRGPWGWSLLAIVWIAAIIGVALKLQFGPATKPRLSTAMYLAMGWVGVIAFQPLLASMGWAGVAWLLGGGLAYSVGVIFFACDQRIRFGHCVWHFFVLGGSLCHAVAVTAYGIAVAR